MLSVDFWYCLPETKTVPLQYKCFLLQAQSAKEYDVHARVVARALRQQYVLPSCTVVLKTLASFITDLPYHLPSASVTSLPALVHHSLHPPAISTKVFPTFVPPSGSLSKIFLPTLVLSIQITSYGHSTLFLSISAIPSDISNVAVISLVCLTTRSRAHNILRLPVGLSANN